MAPAGAAQAPARSARPARRTTRRRSPLLAAPWSKPHPRMRSSGVVRDLAAARSVAVELACAAGRLQVERRVTGLVRRVKAHANDLVSDVDLASEALIADGVRSRWPDDGLIGEEGASASGNSGWTWVIDPLDGTLNYLTGAGRGRCPSRSRRASPRGSR